MAVFTVLNGVQVCVTVKYSNIWKIDLLKETPCFSDWLQATSSGKSHNTNWSLHRYFCHI